MPCVICLRGKGSRLSKLSFIHLCAAKWQMSVLSFMVWHALAGDLPCTDQCYMIISPGRPVATRSRTKHEATAGSWAGIQYQHELEDQTKDS